VRRNSHSIVTNFEEDKSEYLWYRFWL